MKPSTRIVAVISIAAMGILAYVVWQKTFNADIPEGFATGNGRLEAEEVDIAAKYAGRVRDVLVREGDTVSKDQVLALMDTRELDAELKKAQAQHRQAEQQRLHAKAMLTQRVSEAGYAHQELDRAIFLLEKGHVSREVVDQRITAKDAADAAVNAAHAEIGAADEVILVAEAEIERLKAQIDESVLRAPVAGRVLYRLTEPGEVLAVGGKVLTVIDLNNVYMTLFLPQTIVGKVPIGAEARIVLDALPEQVIKSRISFVADKAQFTPKEVETRSEREKLVFRIKAKVLTPGSQVLKPGMPGMTFIRYDKNASWPEHLK